MLSIVVILTPSALSSVVKEPANIVPPSEKFPVPLLSPTAALIISTESSNEKPAKLARDFSYKLRSGSNAYTLQ